MNKDFLIEIGCEELPSSAMIQLSKALEENIISELNKESLAFEQAISYVSPRHLAVKITSLVTEQESKLVSRKGPSKKAAFDESGEPTKALLGFLRSCNAEVSDLTTVTEKKGEWLVYESQQVGKNTTDLLPEIVNTAIKKLPIPKPMRWGDKDVQFVRPIHWVLMMFGSDVVTATVLGLATGRMTYGHRFQAPEPISLNHVNDYEDKLEKAFVMVDFDKRKKLIEKQIHQCAKDCDGQLIENESLLSEVATINEWPTAIAVPFDKSFLTVPKEALIESMASHQKCFSLQDSEGALLPYFITVSNISPKSIDSIKVGNERVMRARLSDAKFFFDSDRKSSLSDKASGLNKVIFQNQLGSIQDKVDRVKKLSISIAEMFSIDQTTVQRAAELSKASLVTEMVAEFPSLQDVMGYYYALNDGEDINIAIAIKEYYLPRYSGDALPSTQEGGILAVADRLDTLVGIFGINQKPTGVKDPFQLRRLALGVVRILIELNRDANLITLLESSLKTYKIELPNRKTLSELNQFFIDRFSVYANKQLGYRSDVINAVLSNNSEIVFSDLIRRCEALQNFVVKSEAAVLIQGFKRVSNLLKKQNVENLQSQVVNESLIELSQEQALYEAMISMQDNISSMITNKSYADALVSLSTLKQPVDEFFEHVMVNEQDEKIKLNRLTILAHLEKLFSGFANIALIQDN